MPKGTKTSRFGSSARISHDASGYYSARLNSELPGVQPDMVMVENGLPEELKNRIIPQSSECMTRVPDCSVHLMITSPPYNVRKEYDSDLNLQEYLGLLERVFRECHRVLTDGGRACINVANLGRKPYIPLSDYISAIMLEIGFRMRGEIIWNKGAGAGVSLAWGSYQSASNPVLRDVHEYILIFSKGSYARPRKEHRNTITREEFMEWTKSIWSFNPESARKIGHPAPFPIELPRRLIQLYSYEGDVVLDPFLGSGTTAMAALQSNRVFLGYETDPGYVELANNRIRGDDHAG